DLLIPAIPAFGSKEVTIERAIEVGVVGDWFHLVMGPWRFWLAIDREGRFPDVMAAVPKTPGTRWLVADEDAQLLLEAMPRMPRSLDGDVQTVTLDLGRAIVVRAIGSADGDPLELALAKSR